MEKLLLFRQDDVCLVRCLPVCFSVFLFCKISLVLSTRYERRCEFLIEDGSGWDAQTRWMKLDMVISICINEGYTLHHVAYCLSHDKYCCFSIFIAFL